MQSVIPVLIGRGKEERVYPVPEDAGDMTAHLTRLARTGIYIMRAALRGKRGPFTLSLTVIRSVEDDIDEGRLPTQTGYRNPDIFGGAYPLFKQYPASTEPGGRIAEDLRHDQAFRVGASLLTLGKVARKIIAHPDTQHTRDPSRPGLPREHTIDDYTMRVSHAAQRRVEKILNTYQPVSVGLSAHAYDGEFEPTLRFSARTIVGGHALAANVTAQSYSGGVPEIFLQAESYHVNQRGNITEVNDNSGTFVDTVRTIANALHAAMQPE